MPWLCFLNGYADFYQHGLMQSLTFDDIECDEIMEYFLALSKEKMLSYLSYVDESKGRCLT